MMEIEICSKSWADHAPPHAARCSKKTFVQPYKKITKLSVNSAVGTLAFHPTSDRVGLRFHAHPKSAKLPSHRPRVSSPYQKKIPPLTQCARPLKTLLARKMPVYVTMPVVSAMKPRTRIVRSMIS